MPLRLSEQEKDETYYQIKKAFSDFQYFDLLIAAPLRQMIEDSTKKDFGVDTAKSIMKDYVDMSLYQNEKQKEELKKVEQILTASQVLLHSKSAYGQSVMWNDASRLLSEYPDFDSVKSDAKELQYLLNFRNFMAVALTLLNAGGNKIFLLRVIERLEGSGNEYITGSGQKISVTRRIAIYEKEGNVKSHKTGKKQNKNETADTTAQDPAAKRRKTNSIPAASAAAPPLAVAPLTSLPRAVEPLPPGTELILGPSSILGPSYAELDNLLPGALPEQSIKAEDLLLGLARLPTDGSHFPHIPETKFSSEQELRLSRMFSDGSLNGMCTEEANALADSLM